MDHKLFIKVIKIVNGLLSQMVIACWQLKQFLKLCIQIKDTALHLIEFLR